jgi:putative membrane protein
MRVLLMVGAFVLVTPALAQMGNPGNMTPGTAQSARGVPAPNETNIQDQLFTRLVARGGAAEVDFGQLAERKTQNEAVKEFARHMVQDHGKANEELANVANSAQIPLPGDLDPDQKDLRAKLESAAGGVFDLTYMQGQVVEHQKSVILLQWEIGQGQNAPLQQWAVATLRVVLAHLEMAKSVLTDLAARSSQDSMQVAPTAAPAARDRPAQKQ